MQGGTEEAGEEEGDDAGGAPLSALQRLSLQRSKAGHPSGATKAPGTRGLGGGGRAGLAKKNLASLAPPALQQQPKDTSSRLAQLAAAKRSSSKRSADVADPATIQNSLSSVSSSSSSSSAATSRPSKLAALAANRATKDLSPGASLAESQVTEPSESGKPLSKLQQRVQAAKLKKTGPESKPSEEEVLAERRREQEVEERERQRRELLPSGDAIVSLFPSERRSNTGASSCFVNILQSQKEEYTGQEVPGGSPFEQGCEEHSRYGNVFSKPSPDDIVLKAREGTNLAVRN